MSTPVFVDFDDLLEADLPAPDWLARIASWNSTAAPFPDALCVHELIEAQVARSPQRVALRFEQESLTYAELNTRANQLAHFLRAQGVKPDSCVGLGAERSLAMVIGLLGILKAGAAYVPLDMSYPEQRLRYMIDNSGFQLLLSHVSVAERAADLQQLSDDVRLVLIDAPATLAMLAGYSGDNPARQAGQCARSLAYVIYTSGSTGLPKGVMVEHRSLINRIDWIQKQYPLDGADLFLQKTPFSFDVSVSELIWPFTAGACLVLARPDGHRDVEYLSRVIQDYGITALHFVPSMLALMLRGGGWSQCTSVRLVFASGEALSADSVRQHYALHAAPLINLYGPTEAAIEVSYWNCPRDGQLARVAIGKPIQNIELHILDAARRPVAPGASGELYIGGVGVARGYLKRPELTAERFVEDPFSGRPGARLYRSGDLACFRADGTIDYLGRIDSQVKINGVRIEPGEIESQLRQHPQVTGAVVLAREDIPGDKHLVAYVTLAGDGRASAAPSAMLRRYLLAVLPAAMVPALFVCMAELPLSPSGKVDAQALPLPQPTLRRLAALAALP